MSAPDITAIVLAAGQSRRMGNKHKLLARVQDKPVIRYTVENILRSRAGHVVVVTGNDAAHIETALQDLPVTFLNNTGYESGLAGSLVCGVSSLDTHVDAALICLGDMPLVTPHAIDTLITAYSSESRDVICVPTYRNVQGNPVLWARSFFSVLKKLKGDQGGKKLLGEHNSSVRRIDMPNEPGVVFDIDTPTDLSHFREKLSA